MYELKTLANSAGIWSEWEKVTRLWDGLHLEIQQQLWQEKLSAECSRWDEVIAVAENEELALGLTEKAHHSSAPGGGDKSN